MNDAANKLEMVYFFIWGIGVNGADYKCKKA